MANKNLSKAKNAKQDEFYTQYADIEKEINAYLEYNPDTFRDKIILLPCDDPEWSNFTRYFALHFEDLGLRKLISTSYAPDSKQLKQPLQLTLFETESPQFDPAKAQTRGKLFILDRDVDGNGRIDIDDLQWKYLEGDGDFRSAEVRAFRDEADIIVTNPPFSLFREFFAWVMENDKKMLVIGNTNAITYKEVFPAIKENRLWLGVTNFNTGMYFRVPDGFEYASTYKFDRIRNGVNVNRVSSCCWFTNIEHGRRHQPLQLMTMADNLKFSKHKEIKGRNSYIQYENYDAIEIPYFDAIPSDYEGMMGVPITFLDKYCPEQFEIIGISLQLATTKPYDLPKEKMGGPAFYTKANGEYQRMYGRIVIRKKQ